MAAERLPATGSPAEPHADPRSGSWGCDTADVVMFPRFLRMVFRDAGSVVDAVADGDRRRTTLAVRHLRQIAHALESHHHGEDMFLWDDLERRSPACALHVEQMRAQHAEIEKHLTALGASVDAWRASTRRREAIAVREQLDRLTAALDDHLGQEEIDILPVAATSFTPAEWGRLEHHGRRTVPPRWLFIQLGFMLESMPAAEQGAFLRALPAPARAAWRLVGRSSFRRHRARLFPARRTTT